MYDGLAEADKMTVNEYFMKRYVVITDPAMTSYMDMNLMAETEYMYRVKAVNAAGAGMWSDTAMATTEATNMAPTAGADIADQTVMVDATVMVQSTITDADTDDTLTWSAMSNMPAYATATVDNMGMVTITGVAEGMATITVTATDIADATATQDIMVTVEAANTPPMAVGTIDPVTVTAGEMSDAMDVSAYFSDANTDDTLTYTAMSDMMSYATVSVSGSMLTITGVAAGSATITVTATDIADATATQEIMVTVEAAEPEEVGPATGVTTGPFNDGGVIRVNWDPAPNATGYIIYAVNVDELNNPDGQIVVAPVNDAAKETYNLGGLKSGDTYDIYVVATAKEMVAWPASADVKQVAAE